MRPRHEEWEVGKGRVDPGRLAGKLARSPMRFLPYRVEASVEEWLGAAACTLVIVSLWLHLPVTDVVAFVLAQLETMFES